MSNKTCFFIGHRTICDDIENKLIEVIEQHINEYGVINFTVGHYGKFDYLVQRILSNLKKEKYPQLVLDVLLPYLPERKELAPHIYEGFCMVCPDEMLERGPRRYSIVQANRNQIKKSDYLITYNRNHIGNTRNFVKYAKNLEKKGLIKVTEV